MGHKQGKCISLTHWPLIILPQALKITARLLCYVGADTWLLPAQTPQKRGWKGGQQCWSSPPVTKQFKTLVPFENATWLDWDVDMLHMPRVRGNGFSIENIFFTTATYSLHCSSAVDMMPNLLLAPYGAYQNLPWITEPKTREGTRLKQGGKHIQTSNTGEKVFSISPSPQQSHQMLSFSDRSVGIASYYSKESPSYKIINKKIWKWRSYWVPIFKHCY